MARLLAIALLGLLPSGLAGPACAQKYKDTSDCIQRCSTKWGFPGLMMGNDPWGSVMQTTGKTIDDFYLVVAKACGEENAATTANASSSTSTSPHATASSSGHIVAHGGLVTQATSSVAPTSTSSHFVTSTRMKTSATTHSTTTSSTHKPTPELAKPKTSTTSTHTTAQAEHTAQSSSNSNSGSSGSNSNSGNSNSKSNSSGNSGNSNSNSGSSNSNNNPGSSSSNSNSGSSSSSSSGNGSRASNSDVQAYLTAHNTIRAQHGAVPVTWSNDAASKAQEWADKCLNKHSGGTLGPLGENLAAGTGTFTIAQAVKAWTDEVSEYNSNNPQPSHFTQVVWKASTQIGCAVQTCDGIFPGFGAAQYYVCEYSVQGNVIGEFGENVQA